MTTTTDPRFARALAFERAMHAAVGRVVTASWGQAFLRPEIGRCHEENMIWGIGDAAGLDAEALSAEADRLIGGAGLRHRQIMLEGAAADARRDGLVALGYGAARHVYLAHDGVPPPAPGAPVVAATADELAAGEERYLRTDPATAYGRDDETRAHIVEHHRTYGSAGADERIFGVRDGDDLVAWAKLWTREGTAQVEDVVCLEAYRGRGYGRAVVAAATRAALEEGPELLFIVADDADWPKELYGRLGFHPVGHVGMFVRMAPPAGPGHPHPRPHAARRGST
jgi:GNAT superfamily N-acetyltransferase